MGIGGGTGDDNGSKDANRSWGGEVCWGSPDGKGMIAKINVPHQAVGAKRHKWPVINEKWNTEKAHTMEEPLHVM